jgi:hypothetical protein
VKTTGINTHILTTGLVKTPGTTTEVLTTEQVKTTGITNEVLTTELVKTMGINTEVLPAWRNGLYHLKLLSFIYKMMYKTPTFAEPQQY